MSPMVEEVDQDVAVCLGGDFWEYVEARPSVRAEKTPIVDQFKRQDQEEVIHCDTAFLLFTESEGEPTRGGQGLQFTECAGELVITSQRVLFFNEGPKDPVPLACMALAVVDRVIKLQHTRLSSTEACQLKLLQIQCLESHLHTGTSTVEDQFSRLLFLFKYLGVVVSGKDLRTVVFGFPPSNHGARSAALDSILQSVSSLQSVWSSLSLQSCTPRDHSLLDEEYQRLLRLRDPKSWRISSANENYGLCSTYPSKLVLPVSVSDEDVLQAATFRARGRLPTFCWQHPKTGAVLSRSGQPKVGFMQNSRSDADEALVAALRASDRNQPNRKLVIADARPRKNALANGAMGGGSEPRGHYRSSEVVYLGIENIHAVRESMQKLREYLDQFGASRSLCVVLKNGGSWGGSWGLSTAAAAEAFFSTSWLQHVHALLCGASFIASQIALDGASVLVHCSDGWDRTPSLLCCALLLLDPHYRSREGFKALVELHWASFGHQFAERMGVCSGGAAMATASGSPEGSAAASGPHLSGNRGHGAGSNNHSPIFLQWIDCTAQLLRFYPKAFQFTTAFLVELLDLSLSCRFYNFLCNSEQERAQSGVHHHFPCIWHHLDEVDIMNGGAFRNPLYRPEAHQDALLPPAAALSPILLPELYLRWSCPKGGLECRRGHAATCCGQGGSLMEDRIRESSQHVTALDKELSEVKKRSETLSFNLECALAKGEAAREREKKALQEVADLKQMLAGVGEVKRVSEQMVSLKLKDLGGARTCCDRHCTGCGSEGFAVDSHAMRQPVNETHFGPAQSRPLSVST